MIRTEPSRTTAAMEMAIQYGEYLIRHYSDQAEDLGWDVQLPASPGRLHWYNPENIDSGTSGVILFLLELYRQSKEERFLTLADDALQASIRYCRNHPTENYSFYAGRAGVVYVIIQRCLLLKQSSESDASALYKDLTDECMRIIAPANGQFLNDAYTSDYIYNGRSGTLLVILLLYRLTGDETLLVQIDQFVTRILANANVSEQGLSWSSSDEYSVKDGCGFAYGAAGIRYVLQEICKYSDNEVIRLVIGEIDRFTSSCWIEEWGNWADYRVGILHRSVLDVYKNAYLKGDEDIFRPRNTLSWADGAAGILGSLGKTGQEIDPAGVRGMAGLTSLFNGLAGLGVYLLKAEKGVQEIVPAIERELHRSEVSLAGGLMHGNPGKLYFLLKKESMDEGNENILFPSSDIGERVPFSNSCLALRSSVVRLNFLKKYYSRTISALKALGSASIPVYLESPLTAGFDHYLDRFPTFLASQSWPGGNSRIKEYLVDLAHYEKEKMVFERVWRKGMLEGYLSGLVYLDATMKGLNMPDEWLLTQNIVTREDIRIVPVKKNWILLDKLEYVTDPAKELMEILMDASEATRIILQPSSTYKTIETELRFDYRMILPCFTRPKTVGQALSEINFYIRSLPEDQLGKILEMLDFSGFLRHDDFLRLLDGMVLNQIKAFLYRRFLLFCHPA